MFKIFFKKDTNKRIFKKVSTKKSKKVSDFSKDEVEFLRQKINDRLEFYKSLYYEHGISLEWNRVSIRNQSTRWGSCSNKRNLNFNFKMKNLPNELFDYIIVHELCHLLQMNHGVDFWKLVSIAFPDFQILRSTLKSIRF
ncbi:MAG: hypothetical protein QG614_78 [Patescibacteria group bacterium]|nr:hypothetical protein [Patescibacteria group bacterium]